MGGTLCSYHSAPPFALSLSRIPSSQARLLCTIHLSRIGFSPATPPRCGFSASHSPRCISWAGARYGFHRDELLTYSNARDLEWGYVVYPPVTAFLARIELALFGTSLIGFRFFAAIASGFVAVLTGFMARAMGGGRQAMLVSAFAASIGGPVFFTGSFMSYMSFDLLWWVAVAWCVSRLLQSDDARWWLGIGAAIGLGLMTKVHDGVLCCRPPRRNAPGSEPPLFSQRLVLVRRGAGAAHRRTQPLVAIPAPLRRPCLDAQHPHPRHWPGPHGQLSPEAVLELSLIHILRLGSACDLICGDIDPSERSCTRERRNCAVTMGSVDGAEVIVVVPAKQHRNIARIINQVEQAHSLLFECGGDLH